MKLPRPYVSIDIETTGLNPDTCQVLEVAAVIEDWKSDIDALPVFHRLIEHDQIVGEPFALALNHRILAELAKPPGECETLRCEPWEVRGLLASFLERYKIDPDEAILAAGKNFSGFDRPFLNRLPHFDLKFHHRVIDPGMAYWNPLIDETPPDTKTCKERAGIQGEVSHRAVDDARDIIRIIRSKFHYGNH
jgi:oligoribonuclease (3'-5' exoribonuclease)